jgi:hypothetical protein
VTKENWGRNRSKPICILEVFFSFRRVSFDFLTGILTKKSCRGKVFNYYFFYGDASISGPYGSCVFLLLSMKSGPRKPWVMFLTFYIISSFCGKKILLGNFLTSMNWNFSKNILVKNYRKFSETLICTYPLLFLYWVESRTVQGGITFKRNTQTKENGGSMD